MMNDRARAHKQRLKQLGDTLSGTLSEQALRIEVDTRRAADEYRRVLAQYPQKPKRRGVKHRPALVVVGPEEKLTAHQVAAVQKLDEQQAVSEGNSPWWSDRQITKGSPLPLHYRPASERFSNKRAKGSLPTPREAKKGSSFYNRYAWRTGYWAAFGFLVAAMFIPILWPAVGALATEGVVLLGTLLGAMAGIISGVVQDCLARCNKKQPALSSHKEEDDRADEASSPSRLSDHSASPVLRTTSTGAYHRRGFVLAEEKTSLLTVSSEERDSPESRESPDAQPLPPSATQITEKMIEALDASLQPADAKSGHGVKSPPRSPFSS